LAAALEVMESLHAPSEQVLRQLDTFFDPLRTADRFVPLLACWVDLERLFEQSFSRGVAGVSPISTGLGRMRELVARAAELARWRGPVRSLKLFLETATGETGFLIEERPAGHPFHLCVRAREGSLPHRALIERIIEFEKPAYVTYELR